jgi:hypothetical protein
VLSGPPFSISAGLEGLKLQIQAEAGGAGGGIITNLIQAGEVFLVTDVFKVEA